MVVVGAKARAIDKVLRDESGAGGFEDVIVWPTATSSSRYSSNSYSSNIQRKKGPEEEDILGYGVAEPTPRRQDGQQRPRRSSLSHKDKNQRSHRRASIGYTGEMTLTLPNRKTIKKRRSITFDDDNNLTHPIDNITTDDPDADNEILNNKRQLWFRQEEYRHIERNIRNLVTSSKGNSNNSKDRPTWIDNDEEESIRGLETILDSSIAVERQAAIQSVLDDQRRQRQAGYFDEQELSMEYQFLSMDAQQIASDRAKRDAQEIKGYMAKTKQVHKKMMRRMSC